MALLFWRKLAILNIGLLIVLLRLYNLLISKIGKYSNKTSIFPAEDENGYPFFDQIYCNLQSLFILTNTLNNFTIDSPAQNINNIKQCNFYERLLICKGNAHCHNKLKENNLYLPNIKVIPSHSVYEYNNLTENLIWNSIYELNNFDNKETDYYYKIISGYHSYIKMLMYKDNYDSIKEKIAFSYEYLNNMFYLHSLLIKSLFMSYNNKYTSMNDNIFVKLNESNAIEYTDQGLKYSGDILLNITDTNIQHELINTFNVIEGMISCLNNSNIKASSISEIRALKTMLKIIFNKERINESEQSNYELFIKNYLKSIYYLFASDYNIKGISIKYKEYEGYIFISFVGFGAMILLLVSYYFIKNKDYYSRNTKYKKHATYKSVEEINKMKANQNKKVEINKQKDSNKNTKENNINKTLSPEDIAYMETLKGNAQLKGNEFIFTK